jgi:membrane protein DedA with SNARE-associated domain
VIVPALLPPPAPFKIFVLLAGVVAIPVWQFVTAIIIVRIIRYGGLGVLAVLYGDQAFTFMHDHAREAALWLAAIALVLGLTWIMISRRRTPSQNG